jgi:hypothetical protein
MPFARNALIIGFTSSAVIAKAGVPAALAACHTAFVTDGRSPQVVLVLDLQPARLA